MKTLGNWLVLNIIAPTYIWLMERLFGWRVEGDWQPEARKFVLLTEPHTSNTDLMVVFYWACKVRRQVRFVTKKEIESWFVVGRLLRWMGAIYIDRDAPLAALKTIIKAVRSNDDFVLLIAPSGTRSYSDGWKPGFYYVAQKTNIPIVPASADFARKRAIIAPVLYPTGDIHADIEHMRPFFEGITARHPERVAPIRLLTDDTAEKTTV